MHSQLLMCKRKIPQNYGRSVRVDAVSVNVNVSGVTSFRFCTHNEFVCLHSSKFNTFAERQCKHTSKATGRNCNLNGEHKFSSNSNDAAFQLQSVGKNRIFQRPNRRSLQCMWKRHIRCVVLPATKRFFNLYCHSNWEIKCRRWQKKIEIEINYWFGIDGPAKCEIGTRLWCANRKAMPNWKWSAEKKTNGSEKI